MYMREIEGPMFQTVVVRSDGNGDVGARAPANDISQYSVNPLIRALTPKSPAT
jgi:hypothetical protein